MAGQIGGLPLPLLLLSLAVLDLTLGTTATDVTVTTSPTLPTSSTPTKTMALLPTTDSTTAATVPPSSPETSAPEVLTDAFTASDATPRGSGTAASSITTPQARGSAARSTPGSPTGTTVQPDPTPTGPGLTTGTPTPIPMATTPDCAETTIVTSVGTSTALAVSSFGVKTSPLPPSPSSPLSSTWVGTTLGTSTRQAPAVTMLLGSTSPGTGSTSSPTAPAPTATSDEPSTTPLDTAATPVTSMGVPGSTSVPSQPAGTTAGTTPGTSTPTAPETSSAAAVPRAQSERAVVSQGRWCWEPSLNITPVAERWDGPRQPGCFPGLFSVVTIPSASRGRHGPRLKGPGLLQSWPGRPALPAAHGCPGSSGAADVCSALHPSLGASVSGGNPLFAANTSGPTWMLLLCWAKKTCKPQCQGCGERSERCLGGGIGSRLPGHGWAERRAAPAPAAAEPRWPCAAPRAGYHCHGCDSHHVHNSPYLPNTYGDFSTAAHQHLHHCSHSPSLQL
ncbi:sialidase-like isoform X2 [Accipiter gentilis]|uniref:sialidase-like isoform X2 n=1 Tax=Astur gentilis TaxID=8957 RepID=UPI002110B7CB|nr:sialidase-like isoform X2 [Accipiter gentilis]